MLNCFPHDAFPIYLGVFLRQFLGLLVVDHLQAVFEPPQEGIGLRHLARRLGLDLAMLREATQRIRDPPRAEVRQSRSEEHTSELQSLMRISYAVFCLKNKKLTNYKNNIHHQ